jgi:hypothetical protein
MFDIKVEAWKLYQLPVRVKDFQQLSDHENSILLPNEANKSF